MHTLTKNSTTKNSFAFSNLGLTLRQYRDASDYDAVAQVLYASRTADGLEESRTGQQLAEFYSVSRDFEPERDICLVESGSKLVAYAVTRWWEEQDQTFVHGIIVHVLPEWRGKGIESELLAQGEVRSIESAQKHSQAGTSWFQFFVPIEQTWMIQVLEATGYTPARYFYDMVRPNLENIPNLGLPVGLAVRPATPEQYRQIWQAAVEAFAEHWGEQVHDDDDFQHFLKMPNFNPSLWQVAWDGDQVAGMVLNYFDAKENAQYNRKLGYTEDISVRKPYRGRGVAKALITRSMKMFRDMGFDSTSLKVDSENATGALHLYESLGYETTRKTITYRKRIE